METNNSFLTVSNLTKYIKTMFESEPFLSSIMVEGEISNFKNNSSGHFYFTLKDENAQISCVMFKSSAQLVNFKPRDGVKVYVKGAIKVYEKSGQYQIYVNAMKEQGLGDLYQRYEELKKKLSSKGYFDEKNKQALPLYPKNIALLTSPTGAVIEDLKRTITERSQFSDLTLFPTKVQGQDAKYSIVENIRRANNDPSIDVIILARGGGSIEDLWPFNEEIVADAIFTSTKPIVSAVGHETDFTISDFTADLRVATPTAAALFVVKDSKELKRELVSFSGRLDLAYKTIIDTNLQYLKRVISLSAIEKSEKLLINHKQTLINLSNRLDNLSPRNILKKNGETLALTLNNLNKTYQSLLDNKKHNIEIANERIKVLSPANSIRQSKEKVQNYEIEITKNFVASINSLKHCFNVYNEKLALLNPMSVIDKGYTITQKNGNIVKSVKSLNDGDEIDTIMKDGIITSVVKNIKE